MAARHSGKSTPRPPDISPVVPLALARCRARHYCAPRHEIGFQLRAGARSVAGTLQLTVTQPRGPVDLVLDWRGEPVLDVQVSGQLVPNDASALFPCFDPPGLKGRFRLALELPAGWRAVASASAILERRGFGRCAGATFLREDRILVRHPRSRAWRQCRAMLVLHETTHHWMGNLVTMRWFDDLWLKEGFANFLAYSALKPLLAECDIERA